MQDGEADQDRTKCFMQFLQPLFAPERVQGLHESAHTKREHECDQGQHHQRAERIVARMRVRLARNDMAHVPAQSAGCREEI